MDDHDLNSEEQEVAPLENEHDVSTQSDQAEQAEAIRKAEAQDRDWRAMRQRQKEMEMALKQKDELLEKFMQQQRPQVAQTVVEPEESDDDFVPAGKVKGIAKRTMQPLEKELQELKAELALQKQQKQLQSLHSQYPDFNDIVNVETLELLEKHEPELAATIAQFNDPYKIGLQSYKYIKALGLVDKLPDSRRSKEVINKIEKNAKAVQSPMAYDKRPIAQAFKSTQAENTRLYEEMMHYAAMANGL